jgi:hypothetical protein
MAVRMARLTRTSSGLWTSRKVIPSDVRAAYGKREEKPTWPVTLTASQARSVFLDWLAEVEAKIERLRSAPVLIPSQVLSQRQIRALAGRWYREMLAQHGDHPGDASGWEVARDELIPEKTEEEWRRGVLGLDAGEEARFEASRFVRREHAALIEAEGLQLDDRTASALLEQMAEVYWQFCSNMIQRASGDFRDDTFAETLPEWSPTAAPATELEAAQVVVSLKGLFDAYVAERQPAPATVKAWTRFINHFGDYVGHDDAARIRPEDVVAWKDALLSEKRLNGSQKSAKTVRETYLAALRTVLQNGVDNRRIPSNPAAGVKVRGPKPQRLRDKGFTDEEAKTILAATLTPAPAKLTDGNRLARRWISGGSPGWSVSKAFMRKSGKCWRRAAASTAGLSFIAPAPARQTASAAVPRAWRGRWPSGLPHARDVRRRASGRGPRWRRA